MYTGKNSNMICTSSTSVNTKDTQHQSYNFDFILKPNHDEKWHPENKCALHSQQFAEGEYCDAGKKCVRNDVTCNFCAHSEDGSGPKKIANLSNPRSGDWKYDEEWKYDERSYTENSTRAAANIDWKCKNPYSISDLDRSNFWSPTYFATDHNQDDSIENVDKKNFLHNFREYLVNYQESNGVPRTEYSFSSLIRIMGQATGRSLLALLYVMINVAPVIEIFLYILRFVLDKIINIRNGKDVRQMVIQYIVLAAQLLSIYVCLIFIFGFIVLPIVQMVIGVMAKIMLYN